MKRNLMTEYDKHNISK